MSDVDKAIEVNRAAVNEFLATSDSVADSWTTERAPGKWSPSQVVEHVARVYEESADLVAGSPSKFPNFPTFLRPVMRGLFFNRMLKKETFSNAKTFKPFDPESGPSSTAEGRERLESALGKFEKAVQAQNADMVTSGVFGKVTKSDYVRFQALHTRHHQKQLRHEG